MNPKLSRYLLSIACGILLIAIALMYGCNVVQDAGKTITNSVQGVMHGFQEAKQARALDEADEDELGKSVAILVTNKYAPTDRQKLVQYVNMVGYTLVSTSQKPDRHYVFGVLDTDDIGAYSGPNGYIMVTRGAIQSMRDEAELAGVLAHELTHVMEQHGLSAARSAAVKAGYLDATKSILPLEDVVNFIDTGVDAVVRSGYDKQQETAADAGAVQLLIAAGYDPHSYANFLSHLAALQAAAPRQETNAVASTIKEAMSTHPGIETRYPAVAQEIADAGNPGGATMKERFRANVGM